MANLLQNPLFIEFCETLQNRDLTKKLNDAVKALPSKEKTKAIMDKNKQHERKQETAHRYYIKRKFKNYQKGIISRFMCLDKMTQLNMIVKLTDIFKGE
jgi:hypothetical protein